ncbi:MAG: DUF4846 domain-containing protein [Oceanihabitans sp.]
MKKIVVLCLSLGIASCLIYLAIPLKKEIKTAISIIKPISLINKDSLTIHTRVNTPEGFKRVLYPKGSFENYLQNYKLKPFGSKIINYDNTEYYWQDGHIGILDIPVPKNGLQQCTDALIRVRSEYLWDSNKKEKIGFNFTSGHYCSWLQYAAGYRPIIKGNQVRFKKTKPANYSKSNFYKYLNLVYMYSGTLSLYNELPKINTISNLKVGDMLIKGGSPGHIVIICDEAINKNGEKIFLLFQGNTPAQSVHLVKNLEDTNISPWYQLQKNTAIPVSNYTFQNSKFVRFK